MAEIPLVQFPPGQSPALSGAIAALLCAVLGTVHVVNSAVSTAASSEDATVAQILAVTGTLYTVDGVQFEQACYRAVASVGGEASA